MRSTGQGGWPLVPLRQVFAVRRGATPRNDPAYWDGPHAWLTPEDLSAHDGERVYASRRRLSDSGLASCSAVLSPPGSLVLSSRAPIGYVAETACWAATNQGCMTLVPRRELDSRYFRYQLLASRSALEALGQGATFVELASDSLRSFPLVAPSLEMQQRVANFLDRETAHIDALTRQKRELVQLVDLRRAALRANAVLGRVSGFRAVVATGDLTLPELPRGWRPVRLRHVADEVTVGVVITPSAFYVEEGLPFIRGFNVRPGLVTDYDLARIGPEGNASHPKSILRPGDVLVVRTGQAGAAAVVPDWAVGGNCVDVLIVRCAPSLRPKFLELVLNSEHASHQIETMSVGAIQSHFNVSALRDLVLALPPVHEQDRVIAVVEEEEAQLLRLTGAASRQVELLEEHRQALITATITGQIEVAVDAA